MFSCSSKKRKVITVMNILLSKKVTRTAQDERNAVKMVFNEVSYLPLSSIT